MNEVVKNKRDGKWLLANITGAPESYQWGIVAASQIIVEPPEDGLEEITHDRYSRNVTCEGGRVFVVTVAEMVSPSA